MSLRPSPLTLLKNRDAAAGLCLPSSPAFKAATIVLRHLNTKSFLALVEWLANNDVLCYLRQILFGSRLDRAVWPELFANSDDLASLPPDLLADRASAKPSQGMALNSRLQIQTHCIGLFDRASRSSTDGAETAMLAVPWPFGVSLDRHVTLLCKLQKEHPELAIAMLEDRAADAWALIRSNGSDEQHDAMIRTVMRHWLLYRRLHLQRVVAYVASYRRATLPFLRPLICFYDAVATTAATFADVLARAASRCSNGYLRSRQTGGKAGTPGRTSLPFVFTDAVIKQQEVRPGLEDKKVYEEILDLNLPALLSKVPGILQIVADRKHDGTVMKDRLYAAANVPRASTKALTMFEIGHAGLSPAALILAMASRYAEAVAIAEAVIASPALAWSGSEKIPTRRQSDASVVAKAHDVVAEMMGDAVISLENTTKPLKLAKTFLRLHLSSATVSQTLESQLLAAFDPLFAANWPPMCPPAPVGEAAEVHDRLQSRTEHGRAV